VVRCGGILSFYKTAPKMLSQRGDVFGNTRASHGTEIFVSSNAREFSPAAWLWGLDGYVHVADRSAPGYTPGSISTGGPNSLVYHSATLRPSNRFQHQLKCSELSTKPSPFSKHLKGRKSH